MASKYDDYWRSQAAEIRAAVERAVGGTPATIAVGDVAGLGDRESWYGTASVRGTDVLSSSMAHVTSLARMVSREGICAAWPAVTFRFTVTNDLTLRIESDRVPRSSPAPTVRSAQRPTSPRLVVGSFGAGVALEPAAACSRIHSILDSLPVWTQPRHVTFSNGLYFFYERGETSPHTRDARVVRVGNHPRAENGLAGRLRAHYQPRVGAKNRSVFRRYLGGALIRRSDPDSPCLAPAAGHGHWERQQQSECPRCEPFEGLVTETLRSEFSFRCVQIDDPAERNDLEARLVATLAACTVCSPSTKWLGLHAYPARVRKSGLWNSQSVEGAGLTAHHMERFDVLAKQSLPAPHRASGDLSDTLLVLPCSAAKHGRDELGLPRVQMRDLVGPEAGRILEEGRRSSFGRSGTELDLRSPMRPAVSYYSGQPYATPGVHSGLTDAIGNGLHCLIISGGYGVVRAEEPIHRYNARIGQTKSVWKGRLPTILRDYVGRQQIRRSFVLLSKHYADCVPRGLTADEHWCVPTFDRQHDQGAPVRVVPARIGAELQRVLAALRNGV